MKAVAEEMQIGFLGIGFQPKWTRKDIPIMPKVCFTFFMHLYRVICFLKEHYV